MNRQQILELIVKGKDQASGPLSNVGGSVSSLGSKAAGIAKGGLRVATAGVVALGAAAVGAAVLIGKLALAAAEVEGIRTTFVTLTSDMGTYDEVIGRVRESTRGMISDTDLWAGANKLLGMDIATTDEELNTHLEMATQLGTAYGDNENAIENWALMMANQSIPRLDSFGISSANVRLRIDELTEADESLSREEAFKIAVMEEGRLAMERVGEQGDGMAASMARWKASTENLKNSLGRAFLPALEAVMVPLQKLITEHGPQLIAVAEKLGEWLGENVPVAIEWLTEKSRELSDYWNTTLQPALNKVWAFVKDNASPILAALAVIIGAVVIPAFVAWAAGAIAAAIATITALAPVVIPILLIGAAVGLLVAAWQRDWGGIRTFFTNLWEGSLKPAFESIRSWFVEKIPQALDFLKGKVEWVKDVFDRLKSSLDRVGDILRYVKDRIWDAITAFRNLTLPDWLTPGSPTPLEIGLKGIGQAFTALPIAMPMGAAAGGMAGGEAAVMHITNYFGRDSVRSDEDIRAIVDGIQGSIELQGLRSRIA